MLAAMADLSRQDADLIALCRKRAMAGNATYALAYAVLRTTDAVLRLGASAMLDDEAREAAEHEQKRRR